MKSQEDHKDRREASQIPPKSPLEYWETEDCSQGGLVGNLSERGMIIYSIQDIPIGTELPIRVFFYRENSFDQFSVIGRIVSKSLDRQTGSTGFTCVLTFVSPSLEARSKLRVLLQNKVLQDVFQRLPKDAVFT